MSEAYISAALRRQLIVDFHERCAYCHSPEHLLDTLYEIDHIIPRVAGGVTARGNLCYACPLCNIRTMWLRLGAKPPDWILPPGALE